MEKKNKAHPEEKKKMNKKTWIILGSILIVIIALLVYAFVITSSGYWLVSKLTPDTEEQKMSYSSASDTSQLIANEGFVLLQNNDNFLPMNATEDQKAKLNVFGIRAVQLIFGGGGSSASDAKSAIKLADALESTFELNQDVLNLHYNYFKSGKISIRNTSAPDNTTPSEFVENVLVTVLPEVPSEAYTDTTLYDDGQTILDKALEFSQDAMVVIGRGGYERADLDPAILRPTDEETALLNSVCSTFENVVLVINSAHPMELGFVEQYPAIKSVVWIGYPGESGTEALEAILNGSVNPSGRLPDTWVYDNLSHPASNSFVELSEDGKWLENSFLYEGGHTQKPVNPAFGTDSYPAGHYLQYSEGIYVGYRYFETRHDTDESFDYDSTVIYPFGYGLSYTTFEKDIMAINVEDGKVTVRVSVKNTGDAAGKTVLQIYYNPPYTGAIEKSTVNLVAFKKTNEIPAGETEYYSIEFNLEDMASYDYKENKCYVLEEGKYEIMLKENSHDLIDSETYKLSNSIIYNEENDGKRSTDLATAENQLEFARRFDDQLTREWDENSRAFTGPKDSDAIPSQEIIDALQYVPETDEDLGYTTSDIPEFGVELEEPIMLSDLKNVPKEDPLWDAFISQLTLEEMAHLCGNGAWSINSIERLGVPRSLTPDGSMGITASTYSGAVMGNDKSGVSYPSPVVQAATWNQDMAYLIGQSVALEGQTLGYNGWYSPSMNAHRLPFDGRYFEYYSEDGLLAGKIAAGVVFGATENGMITVIKHFVMHERQHDGRDQMMVWANEQAIREIYLRPFELAVKEGNALGVMSAYNYIGSEWTGGNDALLNKILRDEWGFEGFVITDAHVYQHMNAHQMLVNGGDLSLDVFGAWTGGKGNGLIFLELAENPEYEASIKTSLYNSSKNILFAVSRTWMVEE